MTLGIKEFVRTLVYSYNKLPLRNNFCTKDFPFLNIYKFGVAQLLTKFPILQCVTSSCFTFLKELNVGACAQKKNRLFKIQF